MKQILDKLLWIEELLPREVEALPKYGGMAYYLDMKLILILVEQPKGMYEHKGVSYPFELWNGCILPIEQFKQSAFFLKFSFLENHPANKNWLYIPAETDDFEDEVKQYVREITKRNPLLGTPVKFKAPKETEPAPAGLKKRRKKEKVDKKKENTFLMSVLGRKP